MSALGKRDSYEFGGERVKFHPEWKAEAVKGVKSLSGGSLKDCVLSCFLNMALECTVPSSLSQPTLEPYRKLTIFCFRSSDVLSWWFKYYIIMYTFSTLVHVCWHIFSPLMMTSVLGQHVHHIGHMRACSKFCIDFANWALVLSWICLNKLIEFSPKCSAGVLFPSVSEGCEPNLNVGMQSVWILFFFVLIIYKMFENSKNVLVSCK